MLTRANRHRAQSILEAKVLNPDVADRDAIIYVETGKPPVHVSRTIFRNQVITRARRLQQAGVEARDLVIIAQTQSLESVFAFWGALVAGAIPSMFPTLTQNLDPEIYMGSMAELVRLSKARAVLTTDDFAPHLAQILDSEVLGSSDMLANESQQQTSVEEPYVPRPSDIAFLQHSSGTTGLQKGVALSHNAVLNQLANYGDAIGLNREDVIVSWLPLYHDMGLIAGFVMPLFQGVPLVLMSPFDWVQHPALLFRAIHDYTGTLTWLPNFAYNHSARRIRKRDTDGLSVASMRMFINCSEPVHHESHSLFLNRFRDNGLEEKMLAVSYAMAENTFGVTQTTPGRAPGLDIIDRDALQETGHAQPMKPGDLSSDIRVSCGPPIEGTEVRIVDNEGNSLPERVVGEISVRSNCMLSEYYQRPDLKPFDAGWYMTGDMGYIAGGELYVVGRSKDLIINAGKNIYPQDIEAVVNEIPGVHAGRVVVFGVPDEREGTELIAIVAEVVTEDHEERRKISGSIRRTVTAHSQVTASYVHLVGERWLIKTSSGKIVRAANRNKWLEEKYGLTDTRQKYTGY